MSFLTNEQIQNAKTFIFKNGRLLERKLWEHFFENGSAQDCLKALRAYQNTDGGFGNGIEPDLLCPDSSAVGAEFAMHVLDLLGCHDGDIVIGLVGWIVANQNEAGYIDHPPKKMLDFPHQHWWRNPDQERILMLAGIMKKWGIDEPAFFGKVRSFYQTTSLPPVERYYGYPHFAYLKYCAESDEDQAKLATMTARLPAFLTMHKQHFPLLSRGWVYAKDYVDKAVWIEAANVFQESLQEDGGVRTIYPDLPWWRPIWTLNGCVLLNSGFNL
ncbi:MAG: hypothetical protein EHM40_13055 [Chloroflexi bacterium]|nr:MAG: hypothetical protein EHM40_13055 [Chloroflexota bacterium]